MARRAFSLGSCLGKVGTYCAIGEFRKGSTLKQGLGAGKRCGQEGQSGDGVLHFDIY